MAGDWLKIDYTLPDKPEVARMADRLDIDLDTVVGKLIRFWRWANQQSVTGNSLGVTAAFLDRQTNCPGFTAALIEVGWLKDRNGALSIPRFDRHNTQTAKARALTSDRVKRSRNGPSVTASLPEERRREETRGEKKRSNRDRTDRPIGAARSTPVDRAPVDFLDLSGLDWPAVLQMAEAVAKRVPPKTEDDRRAWLKYAVIAFTTFSEAWLVDSAEAVVNAKETKGTRQAHFVAVLKSKAAEAGTDAETLKGIARRIELPAEIWRSDVLKIGGKTR